ncbi:NHL domain-containing protein [Abeliophyllum distichum]|uniref:NHL domain-containing protein n=1 Tax=Abeliophyllum distichum TaxID=126358 RepID=A0ABD1VU89_9LAMI
MQNSLPLRRFEKTGFDLSGQVTGVEGGGGSGATPPKENSNFSACIEGFGDFYNVESVIKRLAGNGQWGYVDGDLDSAMFDRPKSFAVDYRGNVYVADKNNYAIKKITKSGIVKCRATKCRV